MNATRQDSWMGDEDAILAETVLRYIREGKTQLEALNRLPYTLILPLPQETDKISKGVE